jgi:hypothetical protein
MELIDPTMLFAALPAAIAGFILGGMWTRYKDPAAVESRAIKAAMEALKSLEKPLADPVSAAAEQARRDAQIVAIKAEAAKLV